MPEKMIHPQNTGIKDRKIRVSGVLVNHELIFNTVSHPLYRVHTMYSTIMLAVCATANLTTQKSNSVQSLSYMK